MSAAGLDRRAELDSVLLDRFGTVPLEQLAESAALMMRVDRKYLLGVDRARRVLAEIDSATRVLEVDGVRASAYASVYFDTPDLLSFRLAAQRRRRRFKLRSRTYLDSATTFLEMKTRGARRTTVKDRTAYPSAPDTLTSDAVDYVADALETIGIAGTRAADLRPRLTTRYRRTTLVAGDATARCTIDTELTWHDIDGRVLTAPHLVIVETKSPAGRSDFDRLLWAAGARPVSISKYATGLAALHDELPRNRWSRVLRTAFPIPTESAATPEEFPCSPAA